MIEGSQSAITVLRSGKSSKDDTAWNAWIFNSYNQLTILCVAVWYLCGIGTVTSSKQIIISYPYPFLLCTVQFACSCVVSLAYLKVCNIRRVMNPSASKLLILTSIFYAFGFVFINASMEYVAASFVETVRAMEAITTLVIGSIFLKERSSLLTYLSLVPICGGVALSCSSTAQFSIVGLVLVLLSNVSFSSRSVLSRLMQQLYPESMEQVNFFADISLYGFYLLVPVTVVMEGSALCALAAGTFSAAVSGSSADTVSHRLLRGFAGDVVAAEGTTLVALFDANAAAAVAESAPIVEISYSNAMYSLVLLMLFNGAMFATYNLMSYIILQRTDLITHSVTNVSRRVFTIFFTSFYFNVELNLANITGVAIAVAGVVMFGYFKSREGK